MNKVCINEQLIPKIKKKQGKLKGIISQSLSNEPIHNSIYNRLASQANNNIKSIENNFIPQLMNAQSTINDLVDRSFPYRYHDYKDKSVLKPKKTNKKRSFAIKKSIIANDQSMFYKDMPKSNSICRLLSPNYQSTLDTIINSNKKSCKSILPKLFATSLDNAHDENNRTPNVTHECQYEKTKPYHNSNNENSIVKKNYAVKLIFKKCLEFINKDNKKIKSMNMSQSLDEKNDFKRQSSFFKINKFNIYNRLNDETVNLLRDERKWKPLSKKIETALDIASKYTINLALRNSQSLKKKFKEQETHGGYLFINEESIHHPNIYENKLKEFSTTKMRTSNSHRLMMNFINSTIRRKDLLMKRLERNNKKNMKIKVSEEEAEGRYFKVNLIFQGVTRSKKGNSFINKSL